MRRLNEGLLDQFLAILKQEYFYAFYDHFCIGPGRVRLRR